MSYQQPGFADRGTLLGGECADLIDLAPQGLAEQRITDRPIDKDDVHFDGIARRGQRRQLERRRLLREYRSKTRSGRE